MLYYKSTTLFACGKRGIRTLGTRPMAYYFRGAKVEKRIE